MRLRKPFLRLAAFMLVAGTLQTVPAGAGVEPVLWSGEVRQAGGGAEAAEVIAYLRPKPEQLEPGIPLAPITRTTTDAAGRFTLRTAPTDSMLAVADPWITVMVVAYAADGMGLAVDSNVLIYERIREENHMGRSVIASLDAGFKRAFATIVDSNVTMFVAAAILYFLGSGPVRGFAVSLGLGILTSIVTAVTMTRMMIAVWYQYSRPKKLPI